MTTEVTLKTFAQAQRLKPRRDDDGTLIVPGRVGQLYEHGGGRLAAMVLSGTPRLWGSRRRAGLAAGMELWLDCEDEGILLFDPTDPVQARAAIKIAGVRPKRRVSPEQREALIARLRNARRPAEEGSPSVQNGHGPARQGSGQGKAA